jgi:hypothetical protein
MLSQLQTMEKDDFQMTIARGWNFSFFFSAPPVELQILTPLL